MHLPPYPSDCTHLFKSSEIASGLKWKDQNWMGPKWLDRIVTDCMAATIVDIHTLKLIQLIFLINILHINFCIIKFNWCQHAYISKIMKSNNIAASPSELHAYKLKNYYFLQ